jgi:Fic family protein
MANRPYIYQEAGWPHFIWNQSKVSEILSATKIEQARLLGRMETIGFDLKQDAALRTMTTEIIKSSEIEGEILNAEHVRSSVARHLGMDVAGVVDKHVEGVVEMMMDATGKFTEPLTDDRLFGWHNVLFPTGRSGLKKIVVAAYRNDPMEVVSGPEGGPYRVQFEAPEAPQLADEMKAFLSWFNDPKRYNEDWIVASAVAHLWFATIHPFDDGNGRIARAISDMCLARAEKHAQRFYSLSSQMLKERKAYYNALEAAQTADLDITSWLSWFLGCTTRAIQGSQVTLADVFAKAAFWIKFAQVHFNGRQRKMLNRLFDHFHGKLTTEKWMKMTETPERTARRDIEDLVEKGVLIKNPEGGRSTSYGLAEAREVA